MQSVAPVAFIAHTHPTAAVTLLSSVIARSSFEKAAYTDEAVVLGTPLFVPYAAPGLALGRLFHAELAVYVQKHGRLPSLALLENHGIVAIADTPEAAEAITAMTVKSARIRLGAISVGGLAGLGAEVTSAYFDRKDFSERRRSLSGA